MNILDQDIPFGEDPAPRVWSPNQEEIFQFGVDHPEQGLVINAVAGSGKSTTIKEMSNRVSGSSLFMAFNKAIADELKRELSCDVKTLNALGWRLWRDNLQNAEMDIDKLNKILAQLVDKETQKQFGYTIRRLVGLAKNNAIGIGAPAHAIDFENLIDAYQFDVPLDQLVRVSEVALAVFTASIEDTETFDFDDQLWMPIKAGWVFPFYTNVFVDEAQDLSPIQHMMLAAFAKRGSRIIAVGDRHQAIYGFRGALSGSMDILKESFRMAELPLSVTYRCSQAVTKEAQSFCPHIQHRSNAPLGVVSMSVEDPFLFNQHLVMCRNNAPLFRAIMRHVREKEPCRVLSNFLESFEGFVRSFKCKTTAELLTKLDKWRKAEIEAAEEKGFWGKIAGIEDRCETMKLLCSEYSVVEDVIRVVKELKQSASGPVFATIHKAKGLEHENAYLLRPDLLPAFYAKSDEQLRQEHNIQYVAITRAKMNFTYGEVQGK